MALPVIANVIRCAVRGKCPSGAPWVNVHHVQKAAGANYPASILEWDTELAKLYSDVGYGGVNKGWAHFANPLASTIDFTFTPLDGVAASTTLAHAIVGTSAGEPLPSDTAIVMTHRTTKRGRRYRGRTYFAGIGEADSNGQFLAASRDVLMATAELYRAAVVATTNLDFPVVASYAYETAEPISQYTMNLVFDRQKRRST